MHHGTLQYEGAWSFGDSKKSEWYLLPGKDVPGPGEYNKTAEGHQPKWTIGRAERSLTQVSQSNVGVGTYDPKPSAVMPSPTNATIGTGGKRKRNLRMKTGSDYNPNYDLTKQKSPSFSMGYHMETEYDNKMPGPADYNTALQKSLGNRSQHYFTMSKRQHKTLNKSTAAVGMYNIASDELPNYRRIKFGSSSRPDESLNVSSPGIYYNIDLRHRQNAGYTLGKKLPVSFNKDVFPAPNHYNVQEKHSYDTRMEKSMYTSNRSKVVAKGTEKWPSPGSYDIACRLGKERSKTDKDKARQIGFAKSERPEKTPLINVPGPGSYDFPPSFNHTLGKMSWRLDNKLRTEGPAPGSYDLNASTTKDRSKSWKGMHMSLRPDITRSTTNQVGPGEYELSVQLGSELGTMGKSQRNCFASSKNPGPGQYEIPSTIGRLPKYYKLINRKIDDRGCTKTIKYDPKATAMVKLTHMLVKPEQQEGKKKEKQ